MQTQLVFSPHPLLPAASRQVVTDIFLPGETVAEYLERQEIRLGSRPAVLSIDGLVIPREDWERICPKNGSLLTLRAAVEGGGGGSSPLRTILTIAVMIMAPEIAGAIYGAIAEAGAGAWLSAAGMQVLTGAVVIGGQVLINALLPPPKPNLAARAEQVSPTYSLSGGSNRIRPYEPMPVLMGEHRIFPDLGARFYTEFDGDDQVLYQVFNFGLADVALEDFRIGQSPLANYGGVVYEMSGKNGKLSLFPGNVDTQTGVTLSGEEWMAGKFDGAWYLAQYPDVAAYADGPLQHWLKAGKAEGRVPFAGYVAADAGWFVRTSSIDAVALAVDITGSLYRAGDSGVDPLSVTIGMQYRKVGSSDWLPLAYGESTLQYSHYWSAGYYEEIVDGEGGGTYNKWVQLAYGSTDQDQHTDGEAYQVENGGHAGNWRWRPYDEVESWNTVGAAPTREYKVQTTDVTITNGTSKPVRKTYKVAVPRGQYEVRVRRVTDDETDARNQSSMMWSQLRTYQPDDADYTGQTRFALKIKANGQLNGTVEQLSALGKAACPVFVDGQWVTKQTRNPAWWFLWFARGKFLGGRRAFGGGLPDSRIDIEAIKEWATWCDANRLTFSAVLDQKESVAETLTKIARCGRAFPTMATGRYGVVWHAENPPHVAVFGMANIKRGSFNVEYITEQLAEEVVINFINPDLNWQQDTVRALVPGVTLPTREVSLDLFGCTSRDQAGREANLLAASQKYHRRRITWESDMEGLTIQRGDVVVLSHDLTQWDFSGRVVAGDGQHLQLDRAVPFIDGQAHWVGVRFPNGHYEVLSVASVAGEGNTLTLLSAWPSYDDQGLTLHAPNADPDHPPVDYLWFFGPRPTPGKRVRITGIQPQSLQQVKITAVDEEPGYYACENNLYAYTPPPVYTWGASCPPPTDLNLFETLTVDTAGNYSTRLVIQFFPSVAIVKSYIVQGRVANGPWVFLADDSALTYSFADVPLGLYEVRVKAVSSRNASSDWISASIDIAGNHIPLSRIGLPSPMAPRLFYTEAAGAIEQVKFICGYSPVNGVAPDGLLLMYSVWPHQNSVKISGGAMGETLTIGESEILNGSHLAGNPAMQILAGSTHSYIRTTDATHPYPAGIDLAGAYWGHIPGSEWRKATGYDDGGFFFGDPFDVEPQIGQHMDWIELAFRDERVPEFRLGCIANGGQTEVVRWEKIDQVGNAFYLLGVTRGQEGTTPINADGGTLHYYPAPGPGTISHNFAVTDFRLRAGGVFEANANLNLRVPKGSTVTFTCLTWRQTDQAFVRSAIVPVDFGGGL